MGDTAEQSVRATYPRAELVELAGAYRVRANAAPGGRAWLCGWCRTPDRAWRAAAASVAVRRLDRGP